MPSKAVPIPAPVDLHALLARHQAIVNALVARDAAAYREAIIKHYEGSRIEAVRSDAVRSDAVAAPSAE